VSLPSKGWVGIGLAFILLAVGARAQEDPGRASATLRALASRSQSPTSWPRLRHYAESTPDLQQRGLAYFLIGYREYQARQYPLALASLKQAASTGFSLTDYAVYFSGAAAQAMGENHTARDLLQNFSTRFPGTPLRTDALALNAQTFLDDNQGEQAVQLLAADPQVRQIPHLALLLAKGYEQARQPVQAAKAYQEIYYGFPAAAEARDVEDALARLHSQLGADFPALSDEILTSRLDKFFDRSRYHEALDGYTVLLQVRPGSALVPQWTVARAKSLLRLHRVPEALDALEKPFGDNPAMEAERLATLADAYVRQDDVDAFNLMLKQLSELYPNSMAYGSALNSAGVCFVRKNDWITAARYYEPLAGLFAQSEWGEEAHWRVAWAYYLQKDEANARRAFTEHLSRYPRSPHGAAALYWLGRLAESAGAFGEARQIYAALESRFKQSYYAAQERSRRASLPTASAPGSADFPQWSDVVTIAGKLRSLERPPVKFCAPMPPDESLRRFEALASLGLDDLAEQFVKQALADRPNDPDLILALSRLEAQEGDLASALLHMVRLFGNYTDFDFPALPKEVWDLLYPRAYWNLVQKEARARGADAFLAMGLIRQESAFNPRAMSSANARGLMQVLPQTAAHGRRQRQAAARRLLEPAYNIRVGMSYLEQLTRAFGGNMEEALAAYHAGEIRVSDWLSSRSYREPAEFLESIPIASTRAYVEHVLRDAAIYRQLLTGSASFADCRGPARSNSEVGPASGKKNGRKPAQATWRLQGNAGNRVKNQDRLFARNGSLAMFVGHPIS